MRYSLIVAVCLSGVLLGCQIEWPWKKNTKASPYQKEVSFLLNEIFQGTNARSEHYIAAAEFYREILVSNAARLQNEGNAWFLGGQLPEAILAYNRGLQLEPNDAGLRDNLDYVRAQVQYPSDTRGRPEAESWPAWLYQPSSFQVLAVALSFYLLTCVLITRWFMTRRRALLIRAAVVFLLAAACGFLWLYLENNREWRLDHPLVVIHDEKVPLRKGNGPSYPVNPDMPLLARGMEARKIHERAGWLQIQFASGEVGWVEKKSVLVDEP
jgi:tetratricopeptide (TPR) repeat protein